MKEQPFNSAQLQFWKIFDSYDLFMSQLSSFQQNPHQNAIILADLIPIQQVAEFTLHKHMSPATDLLNNIDELTAHGDEFCNILSNLPIQQGIAGRRRKGCLLIISAGIKLSSS